MTRTKEATPKFICEECHELTGAPLSAPSPFDPDDEITGCPNCKAVNSLRQACVADGCHEAATCGTPDHLSYRYAWTCHHHREGA
jgi:hypothetical protein